MKNKGLIFSLCVVLILCFSMAFAVCVGAKEIEKPEKDTTQYTYNGEEQEYKVEESEYYTVSGNKATYAGTQDVVISLKDKKNNTWEDGTTDDLKYTFTIKKASYSMEDVSLERKEVIYDGNAHSLEITGDLPEGISVDLGENSFTEPGVYSVIAVFTGEDENYNKIAPIQSQLVIKKASLSFDLDEDGEDDITVSSEKGIKPSIELEIKETDTSKNEKIPELLEKYDKVFCAYNIKFVINEVSQISNGEVNIQIKLPKDIKGKDIRILHMGKDEVTELECEKVDDAVSFDAQLLKDYNNYVIVYDDSPTFLWLWIVLIVLAVIIVGGIIVIMMVKAGKDETVEAEEETERKK